ncbi:MAG: ABC transporter permease, partial [Acidobacteriota bacterium]
MSRPPMDSGRRVEGLLRAVLRLYPAAFRQRFGDSLLDTFEECYHERTGRVRRLSFCVRTFLNLILQGLRERLQPSFVVRQPTGPIRESTMTAWFTQLAQEFRFALRTLRRRSGAGALAILTIALGIGASSTIFSVVHGVLLRPLPYPEPAGLISVVTHWTGPEANLGSMSYPDLADLRSAAPSIESLVGVNSTSMTLTGLGKPRVLTVTRLTEGLMQTFYLAPHLGRDLRAEEFGPGGPAVVVVSHGFWQSQLGGDPEVLGRVLTLNGLSYEVVGVTPPGFDVPNGRELWIPRRLDVEDCGRACHTMVTLGRLAPGATLEHAQAEVARIAADLTEAYPDSNTNKTFLVRSLHDQIVGEVRPRLLMMLGAVALVVLIACANVANLLLTQAANRSGEIAIRTAIGAGRRHLLTQVFVESSLLAILGGALGLGLTTLSVWLLPRVVEGIPRMHAVAIDGNVLLFTLATVIVVTLLFGTAPAFAFLRSSLEKGLARAGARGATAGRERFRAMLLTAEVALSALLLIGAGLLLRSFGALYSVDLGFEPHGLVRFNTLLPKADYQNLSRVRAFYRQLEERAGALPGVEAVASAWGPPLSRSRAIGDVQIEGLPAPPPGQLREASIQPIGPGWLETMGIERLAGRGFEPRDDIGPDRVVMVNEAFVRQHLEGQ